MLYGLSSRWTNIGKNLFNFTDFFVCKIVLSILILLKLYCQKFHFTNLFFEFQIYGGFCKEKKSAGGRKKDAEEAGKTMADMYLLAPESKII